MMIYELELFTTLEVDWFLFRLDVHLLRLLDHLFLAILLVLGGG